MTLKQMAGVAAVALISTIMNACNDSTEGSTNEKVGDTIGTQDTSLLNNYDNEYPNNRIHMQDTNSRDTTKTRDSIR